MIELQREQAFSPSVYNSDIIAGLVVYENTTVEQMVVQTLDEKNTLLVFTEGGDIEKYIINCGLSRCDWVTM